MLKIVIQCLLLSISGTIKNDTQQQGVNDQQQGVNDQQQGVNDQQQGVNDQQQGVMVSSRV